MKLPSRDTVFGALTIAVLLFITYAVLFSEEAVKQHQDRDTHEALVEKHVRACWQAGGVPQFNWSDYQGCTYPTEEQQK